VKSLNLQANGMCQKADFSGANKLLSATGTGSTSSSQYALESGELFSRPQEVKVRVLGSES